MFVRGRRRLAPACLLDQWVRHAMRVCIVTTEFLGVGATGGIGVGARTLGRHLAAQGFEVHAVVPRSYLRNPPSIIDGVATRTYDRWDLRTFNREVRAADSDVYHCVQASLGTWLVQWAMPDRAHVVECVDPRDWGDWRIDFRLRHRNALGLVPSFVYFGTRPAALSARRADAVQVPARFLEAKVRRLYGSRTNPQFVPMPFDAPADLEKSPSPMVAFIGRLVPRKRPEIVLDLAQRFPNVRFVIIGGGGDGYAGALRRQAAALTNLTFTDFIDQAVDQRLFKHLSQAWILLNTAAREGLPLTFIEAAAHGCAILSQCNPDGYASNFGYHVTDGDFARGLEVLLANGNWKLAGARARQHAMHEHSPATAIKQQQTLYESALARSAERMGGARPNPAPVAAR